MDQNEISLRINGTDFKGWKSVRIAAGIERMARDFTLEATSKWPGSDIAQRIGPGQSCEIYIGQDKILTGYIDSTPIRYDGSSITVGINGRSKTGDLVDCCPLDMEPSGGWSAVDNGNGGPRPLTQMTATQWANRKAEAIAADLARPYQIGVIAQVNTGNPIQNESMQVGETIYELIDRMMRKNHFLATDDENGNLVFIKPGSGGRAGTALELGGNILQASTQLDYKQVYSRYTCYGQGGATEGMPLDVAFSGKASVADTSIFGAARMRVLILRAEGEAYADQCRDRVVYEMAHRAAKAVETIYTVLGWRQQDGSLWRPNQLVRVRDSVIGFDADLLIVEVTWYIDKEGMRTDLKVGPQSGYLTKASKNVQNWSEIQVK